MQTYQRTTVILGLICLLGAPQSARAAPSPRRQPPRMSGAKDKPVAADSRFPGHHPRPNGALLSPLGRASLRLVSERLHIHCRFGGGGCEVRHDFVIRNSGDATTIELPFVSPRMAVLAEVDDKRALVDLDRTLQPNKPAKSAKSARPRRHWSSTGRGLDPATGKTYSLPGPQKRRVLGHHRVRVTFGARAQVKLTLITNSVGGYDRFGRGRTQPEVSFALTRRPNHFVHHHELPLTDPEARPRPSTGPNLQVEWTLPANLILGANTKVTCKRSGTGSEQKCTGRIGPTEKRLRWSMAQPYRRPVGFFLSAGVAFTHRGAEGLLRGGAQLMVRSRKDLVSLSAETDARSRFALAVTYQLFWPYTPHSMEMGVHVELGLALDVVPAVRPAVRLGTVLHMTVVRVNLLFDLYPGELKKGGGPSWRGIIAAGIGF